VIQFEWFVYGFLSGLVAPYVWLAIKKLIKEAQIARRDWNKHD
jgi:hypothetical protein